MREVVGLSISGWALAMLAITILVYGDFTDKQKRTLISWFTKAYLALIIGVATYYLINH